MKIKIIKASSDEKWYKNEIGNIFETYGDAFNYANNGLVFFIKNVQGVKLIKFEDAEIVDNK